MALVLGTDFETSGLDSARDRIVESACVLWDWDCALPLVVQSHLVAADVELSQEIVSLTGITNKLIEDYGVEEGAVFADLAYLMNKADYVMAHFGKDFDEKFARETFSRLGMEWPDKLWLDSSIDVVYPKEVTTRNLQYLAAETGFVNPFRHRAVFDVLTMLRVASDYPLEAIVSRAQEPTLYVAAIVSYEEKDKAKERGYRWCGPQKTWWRKFKSSDYAADKDVCGFRTVILEGPPE